ncbi:caspase family protein [Isosphaeraceae bacterium EP7]
MGVDPGEDLGLDGLGQETSGAVPQEVGQDVLDAGHWPGDWEGCRLFHGGVLLGHFGRLVVLRFTKGTPPKSDRHPQLPVIARDKSMIRDPKYHVLLIGIDAYSVKPLSGCVNDIKAIERLLHDRANIPNEEITCLSSPRGDAARERTSRGKPATLANIRDALGALGSHEVQPDDRVFIYYSGHGARIPVVGPQGAFHCEALVPVDFDQVLNPPKFLLDFELNRLLTAIVKRTTSVTVVLDCCHSTGATRDIMIGQDMQSRSLDFTKDLARYSPLHIGSDSAPPGWDARGAAAVDDCQVVAACLNHELAHEALGDDGVRHGLLTRAFVTLLEQVDAAEIRSITWARIWQRMRGSVEEANPSQHLWMSGSAARAVLAGPPVDGDAGFGLRRTGPNEYVIDSGTLADIDEGARLAVYGERPPIFPELGSREDDAARVSKSLLLVTIAERASAVARCESTPFDIPPGARGRLVQPAPAARLKCAVVPDDPAIVASLRASELLSVVDDREAQVRLERRADSAWIVTDDVAGAKPGYPSLATLRPDQLGLARPVLELYTRYSLPLRMATRCIDLPGQVRVKLLACPAPGLPEAQAQEADLPEMSGDDALGYALDLGSAFCVHVGNASIETLRVTLLNCAGSGRVEFLGDQIIAPRSYYRFWLGNTQGAPFVASAAPGARSCVDRLVAIGTTRMDKDLSSLRNDTRFSDILASKSVGQELTRELSTVPASPPIEKWTATQVLLGVGLPGAGREPTPAHG